MGTIVGIVIAYALIQIQPIFMWLSFVGICCLSYVAAHDRGKQLKDHDHKSIVCDEIVGILPALLIFDFGVQWFYAFVFFRFLDIAKPWPISYCDQQIHGAIGCLLDDVLAGLGTVLLLWIMNY